MSPAPPPLRTVLGERDPNQSNTAVSPSKPPHVSHVTQITSDENAMPIPAKEVKKASKISKQNTKLLDVSEVQLDGEDTGKVPVFDTCDEVRRKIRAFLRRDGVTQAALLRALGKCRRPEGGPISSSSFRTFMDRKGPDAGKDSLVLYCGYVFFEKVRLRDGKPKSKKRQEMEQVWGPGGASFGSRYVICHKDSTPVIDKHGKTRFLRRGGDLH